MSILREQANKLRRDGRDPSTKSVFQIKTETSDEAIRLVLVELPSNREVFTWSKALDPHLHAKSDLLGLMIKAIIELHEAMGVFRIRVTSVEARMGAIKQSETTACLMDALTTHTGDSLYRFKWDDERVDIELADVDNLYITCSPTFTPA